MPALELDNVSFRFGPLANCYEVFTNANLTVQKNEFVAIVGFSGSGKSTLISLLAGLEKPDEGEVRMNGQPIKAPGPDKGIMFQNYSLLPWLSVYANVELGTERQRHEICEYYLSAVGLADSMNKYPGEMSGGMQQRVGIARAIALKPKMLLLDEPFGRLDSLTRMELQDVVLDILDKEKITTMVITHDVDEAIYMSDRVCMMTSGPNAKVGKLLDIPFDRPRNRADVLEHPEYYNLRADLVTFLEDEAHDDEPKSDATASQETAEPTPA
ncbi:UNVERIFIED_CONTAM: hypothetical protein GTU68_000996 [Idotea baltica]|nr:hypothetical protein [Idotea baltica]